MKPDLRQLDQSGATLNQVPVWNGTHWVPSSIDEIVRDVIGAALVAGSGMTVTVNDAGDIITLASSGGGGGSAFVGCHADLAAGITLTSGAVTTLDLVERYDTSGMHSDSVNPSRITIPSAGKWHCVGWTVHGATTGQLQARIVNNGTPARIGFGAGHSSGAALAFVEDDLVLAAGDILTLATYQSSGGNAALYEAYLSVSLLTA